ncbi:hypothetical protein CERZMDRAFT_104050 [Cercospora zeae-maydis SCOH1-5]|uniref:Uncharacterized protein n=1 Tax=Cercospora zeae-maydis SCOH1-5 TaxID=717836 RepID=A0A6A6EY46_9PEZI|nr:hypothetical protein CERZMDRAFT_104050 [Cercospora zeae-maydis SCOH1-5]
MAPELEMIVLVRLRELAGGAKEQVTRCETYGHNKDPLDDLINEAIEKPCLDLGEVRVRIAIPYANYLEERCKDGVYGKLDIIPLNKYESLDIGPPFCRTYIVEIAKDISRGLCLLAKGSIDDVPNNLKKDPWIWETDAMDRWAGKSWLRDVEKAAAKTAADKKA